MDILTDFRKSRQWLKLKAENWVKNWAEKWTWNLNYFCDWTHFAINSFCYFLFIIQIQKSRQVMTIPFKKISHEEALLLQNSGKPQIRFFSAREFTHDVPKIVKCVALCFYAVFPIQIFAARYRDEDCGREKWKTAALRSEPYWTAQKKWNFENKNI